MDLQARRYPLPKHLHVALILRADSPFDRIASRGIANYVRSCTPNWSLYFEGYRADRVPERADSLFDGVIIDPVIYQERQLLHRLKCPVVVIGGEAQAFDPPLGMYAVIVDNFNIGRMAADHLMGRGFTHFGFVGWPQRRHEKWSQARCEGFRSRLNEVGITSSSFTGRARQVRRWRKIIMELTEWLAAQPRPIAIMAANDIRARHVMEAAADIGLRVPDDLAVIGVDNDELICDFVKPSLTTIDPGAFDVGYAAAKTLDDLMSGRPVSERRQVVAPRGVIVRGSTDVIAIGDPDISGTLSFIRTHFHESISTADVLNVTALSRATLDRRLKAICGRTVSDQISHERLTRAKWLLANTQLPIKQISQEVGLSSPQYLTTLLRKDEGITPAAYRKKYSAKKL